MGWADCGEDSEGRPIGYAFAATCDHPECEAKIHRGLDYACGGMHGAGEIGCEKYFCYKHKSEVVHDETTNSFVSICAACAKALVASGKFVEDEDGLIVRADASQARWTEASNG